MPENENQIVHTFTVQAYIGDLSEEEVWDVIESAMSYYMEEHLCETIPAVAALPDDFHWTLDQEVVSSDSKFAKMSRQELIDLLDKVHDSLDGADDCSCLYLCKILGIDPSSQC